MTYTLQHTLISLVPLLSGARILRTTGSGVKHVVIARNGFVARAGQGESGESESGEEEEDVGGGEVHG